jgi:hypothetical protein
MKRSSLVIVVRSSSKRYYAVTETLNIPLLFCMAFPLDAP